VKALVMLIVCAVLSGCASLSAFLDSLGEQKLAVQYATMKYIESAGDDQAQAARAARVRVVVDQVEVRLTDSASIGALRALVESKLPADLPASDRLLAGALLDAVVAELEGKVDDGLLGPDELLAVQRVLGFVRDATAYFGIA